MCRVGLSLIWEVTNLYTPRILSWKSISDKCVMKNMRQSEMSDWQSHRELKRRAVNGFKLNEIKNKDGQTFLIKTQILICNHCGWKGESKEELEESCSTYLVYSSWLDKVTISIWNFYYFLLNDMLYCCASSNIVTTFSNICEADAGLLLVSILLLFLAPRFHMNGNSSNLHLCVLTLEYCTFVWQPIVDFLWININGCLQHTVCAVSDASIILRVFLCVLLFTHNVCWSHSEEAAKVRFTGANNSFHQDLSKRRRIENFIDINIS